MAPPIMPRPFDDLPARGPRGRQGPPGPPGPSGLDGRDDLPGARGWPGSSVSVWIAAAIMLANLIATLAGLR